MADAHIATISKDGISVDILITVNIQHVLDKQVIFFQIPKQDPPLSFNIDLKKLKEAITVKGILEDTNSESGLTKKNNIRAMMQTAGTYTLAWGTGESKVQSYTGSIAKTAITEVAGRTGDEGSQNKTFEIILTFFIGTFKGG